MLIEQNTNYAYKLKYMSQPSFGKVRDLSVRFYRELPQALQDELYEALNRGVDILDSEPQMTAYLFSFGKMHQAKLKYAFNHLPAEFLSQPEINIVDYGCGQALGTMCYADFLHEKYLQKVKTQNANEEQLEIISKLQAYYKSNEDLYNYPGITPSKIRGIANTFVEILIDIVDNIFTGDNDVYEYLISSYPNIFTEDNIIKLSEIRKENNTSVIYRESIKIIGVKNLFNIILSSISESMLESFPEVQSLYEEVDGQYKFRTAYIDLINPMIHDYFGFTITPQLTVSKKEEFNSDEAETEKEFDFLISNLEKSFYDTIDLKVKNLLTRIPKESQYDEYGNQIYYPRQHIMNKVGQLCVSSNTFEEMVEAISNMDDIKYPYKKQLLDIFNDPKYRQTLFRSFEKAKQILREKYLQKVKTVTLIEPSECCLKRAALHTSVFFPQAEIRTIHKTFDELCEGDICCDEHTPTLHILSNVLDMLNFDLERFSSVVKQSLKGYNQFVCVGPYFFDSERDKRMDAFLERMEGNENFSETLGQYQLDPDKEWTCKVKTFSRGDLLSQTFSTKVTEADMNEAVRDESVALYSRDGKRLLKFNNIYNIKIGTEIICDSAFADCESLQQIVIPDSVTSIGDSAFEHCGSLQQIVIPDSVTSIGKEAFRGCESLQQIVIPDSVTSIGDSAFAGCKSLRHIHLPQSVSCIGKNPFELCERLVITSDSVKYTARGGSLIDNNNKIFVSYFGKKCMFTIPDTITCIGDFAFSGRTSLQQIIIPDTVTSIGDYAFSGCKSLQQIIIPDSVTSIGNHAFFFCESLQHIVIPDSVTTISDYAFKWCFSLQQISVPAGEKDRVKAMLTNKLHKLIVEI